jgi:hypothetical protein
MANTKRIVKALNALRPHISNLWNIALEEGFTLEDGDCFIKALMRHMSKYGWDSNIKEFHEIISLAFDITA